MKTTFTLTAALALLPALAFAHGGHVAPEAGHSHLAELALVVIAAVAVVGILHRRGER